MSSFHRPGPASKALSTSLVTSLLLVAGYGCQADRTAPLGGQPGATPEPAGGQLVEDLSIGLIEGAAEYIFGFIADIAVGDDGAIFVADAQAGVVRQYDANGRFVRNFGRQGRGPGEFNAPKLVAVHPDGRVLIGDEGISGAIGADRILVFSGEGTLLDTWSFPGLIEGPITVDAAGNVYVRMKGELTSNGGLVSRPGEMPRAEWDEPVARGVVSAWVSHNWHPLRSPGTIRVRSDGVVLDTITAPTSPAIPYWQPELASGRVYVVYQYTPFVWWAWSPLGHLLSGSSSEYAIRMYDAGRATGAPLRQLRREMAPIEVVADEREENRSAHDVTGANVGRANPGKWVGSVDVPAHKPAYHSVLIGREGRVWVGVHLPSVRMAGDWVEPVTAFDVWQPTGEYLGRVEGPSTIRQAVIDRDVLLTRARDELGVERVVRYRVQWE